eukprot:COSAG04_NODE_16287_length_504_cov_0.893827_2_plen_36_part_01
MVCEHVYVIRFNTSIIDLSSYLGLNLSTCSEWLARL